MNTFRELREKVRQRASGKSVDTSKPLLSQVEVPKIEYQKPSKTVTQKTSKLKDAKFADQCMIVIPDVHSYERDVAGYELAMKSIKVLADNYNVTKVIQIGDLMECGEISGHPPSHIKEKVMDYVDEIDWATSDFWARCQEYAPGASMHALLGNHEHRVNNWLLNRLGRNRLTEDMYEQLDPTTLYRDMGIEVIPYGNENVTDGTLEIFPGLVTLHGWSFAVNCAKEHLDKMMGATSVIFGHTHRIQSYIRRNPMKNELVGAWNIGALAKTNMFWQKGKPCDHGLAFGVVMTHKNGFTVNTLPILGDAHKYIILPNGAVLHT
jgi:hypothetical protein